MRRAFLSSALLVGGLLAAACTEQRSPLPTQAPSLDVTSSTLCDPTLATPIDNQIIALFPNKPELRGAARSQFTNIKRKCPSQIQPAIDMTVDLAGFASKKYQGGRKAGQVDRHANSTVNLSPARPPGRPPDARSHR